MVEEQQVVVGVDGSPDAAAAVRWAAEYAARINAGVLLVTAWMRPVTYGSPAAWAADYWPDKDARVVAEKARADLGQIPGRVEIVTPQGKAGKVLVDLAEHSAALVVGSQGHGALAEAVLGSVSAYCVRHAHCPIVVVR